MTDDQTNDQLRLTTEIMEEAQESAIDVLNALSSSNPIVDFIALQIAAKTYVASTPLPPSGLRQFNHKIHDHRGSSSENWEEFAASPGLESAINEFASGLSPTDLVR